MKKIILALAAVSMLFTACDKDHWDEGDPAYEHIYIIGYYNANGQTQPGPYNIAQGASASVPFQFHSERVRSYDVTTYFYIQTDMVLGTDYKVTDENGTALTANNGVYSLTWPKAVKGKQIIKITAVSGAKGTVNVWTLDPAKGAPSNQDIETTVNIRTNEYEVRGLTQNYKVVVNLN